MKWSRFSIVPICLIFWGHLASAANVIRIAGGPSTGEYIHIAESVCGAMGALFDCQALQTKGTSDNKTQLEEGKADFGLAKANVADEWLKEPAFAAKFKVIRRIGDESLFVFGKPETLKALGSWEGVRQNAALVSIGLPGELSGDAAMFRFLQQSLSPAGSQPSPLKEAEVVVVKDRPSLVEAVKSGKVMLGFITQVPNPDNALFKLINEAGLKVMGVIDPDMVLLGDTFRIKTVTIKNAKWGGLAGKAIQIQTANVPVAIVARTPEGLQGRAAKVQEAAIGKIASIPEADLLPKRGWMQALANSASLKAGAEIDSALKAAKEAAKNARERLKL
jgi:hypothetical protein